MADVHKDNPIVDKPRIIIWASLFIVAMLVLFTIDAAAMSSAVHLFYRSANGVWLTDTVPPEFLRNISE